MRIENMAVEKAQINYYGGKNNQIHPNCWMQKEVLYHSFHEQMN